MSFSSGVAALPHPNVKVANRGLAFVPIPAEVIFDRFFRSDRISLDDRKRYTGKLDLDRLDEGPRSLLIKIQTAFNEALENQDGVFPDGRQRIFHFDYVEATVPNALVFEYEDHCFIGVTGPFIQLLWQT